MPAMNQAGTVAANPSTGQFVMMSPFSGPKGSPFDKDNATNNSTGALNTGIGFGANSPIFFPATPAELIRRGFNLNAIPGVTMPAGTAATTAVLTCIGGGRSGAATNGIAATNPYAVQPLLGFGAGGSRDAGAGPAFTGFEVKLVNASGTIANGAAIQTGYINRTGRTITTAQAAHGSSTTASAAVT